MHLTVVGYYGYKNFGDELLLLGLLHIACKKYNPEKITIITPHISRLQAWCNRHQKLLDNLGVSGALGFNTSVPFLSHKDDLLLIGGGEVITDARSRPHNGWNYLMRYRHYFLHKRVFFAGGIGTPKKIGTKNLLKMSLGRASGVIVREKFSYDIANRYSSRTILHRDFAYDVLEKISLGTQADSSYVIINCNIHIWNNESFEKIKRFYTSWKEVGCDVYFFPGTCGVYDSDKTVFDSLSKKLPELTYYDRTSFSIEDICRFVSGAKAGIAARLHVLLLLKFYGVESEPLVYQEKITRLLDSQ